VNYARINPCYCYIRDEEVVSHTVFSGGRQLIHPVVVWVEYDDGEFLVTEPHFYMHASGPPVPEAIEAFKRIFSGYLDVLSSDEATLGEFLCDQLEYLRSVIRTV
jgi:hypothetical protein